VAKGYGRWLTFLLSRNMLDPLGAPAERITRDRVEAYVADLRANNNASGTTHIRILQLCRMLDVMAPGSRPARLGRLLSKLRAAIGPTRDDRARLPPAATLVELGRSLMNRAEAATQVSPRLRAVAYRDGLMIIVFLASGLRVGNFATLRLAKSLVRRGDIWWIVFEAHQTKNRRSINMPLPPELTPMIVQYLRVWRPLLLPRPRPTTTDDTGLLWLGRYGGLFGPKKVNKRINEITLRELGRAMNPHLFRKLVPTELAIHDPAHVGISQLILGHSTDDTTQKAYNLGQAIDAGRRVQVTIASIRQTPSKGKVR
jgi:integrase/recombinase XerD